MGLGVNSGFNVQAPVAIDDRFVLTKQQMLEMKDSVMPDIYPAWCTDDGNYYIYKKSNTANDTTGKYEVFQAGSGSVVEGSGIEIIEDYSKLSTKTKDSIVYCVADYVDADADMTYPKGFYFYSVELSVWTLISGNSDGSGHIHSNLNVLNKISEDGDGNFTFGGKTLNTSVILWSSTASIKYTVNSLVSYNDQLYRCDVENTDTEFDSSKYTLIAGVITLDKSVYDSLGVDGTDHKLYVVVDNGVYNLYQGNKAIVNNTALNEAFETYNAHINNEANPHNTSLSNLTDVDISSLLDKQIIGYDLTTGKWTNMSMSVGSDGKVKLQSSSESDYLENLLDGVTLQAVDGKLTVKSIAGLLSTITELNYLQGLDDNIMTKFRALGYGNVEAYKTQNFATYADLLAFDFTSLTASKTFIMYVIADEGEDKYGKSTIYMADTSTNSTDNLPMFIGFSSSQRILTEDKVDLTSEVKNQLPQANMDLTGIAKTSDLSQYMKTEDYTGSGTQAVNTAKTLQGLTKTVGDINSSLLPSDLVAGDGVDITTSNGKVTISAPDKAGIQDQLDDHNNKIESLEDSIAEQDSKLESMDARTAIGNQGDYVFATLSADITPTTGGTVIFTNITTNNSKITITDGKIKLYANKSYRIATSLRYRCTASSGYITYMIYDYTNGKYLGNRASVNGSVTSMSQSNAVAYTTPETDIEIGVKVVSINTGDGNIISSDFTYLEIQETGRDIIVDPYKYAQDNQTSYATYAMSQNVTTAEVDQLLPFNTKVCGDLTDDGNGLITCQAGKYSFNVILAGSFANIAFNIYDYTNNKVICRIGGYSGDSNAHYPSVTSVIYESDTEFNVGVKIANMYSTSFAQLDYTMSYFTINKIAVPVSIKYSGRETNTTLLEGELNAAGSYTLSDSIEKYDYLLVTAYGTVGTYKAIKDLRIPVPNIVYTTEASPTLHDIGDNRPSTNSTAISWHYQIPFKFSANNMIVLEAPRFYPTTTISDACICKIEGIKTIVTDASQSEGGTVDIEFEDTNLDIDEL